MISQRRKKSQTSRRRDKETQTEQDRHAEREREREREKEMTSRRKSTGLYRNTHVDTDHYVATVGPQASRVASGRRRAKAFSHDQCSPYVQRCLLTGVCVPRVCATLSAVITSANPGTIHHTASIRRSSGVTMITEE